MDANAEVPFQKRAKKGGRGEKLGVRVRRKMFQKSRAELRS